MLQNFEIERRIGIILPNLGGQLSKFSLAESGVGARSFAGDPEGCCVGVDWRLGAAGVKKL